MAKHPKNRLPDDWRTAFAGTSSDDVFLGIDFATEPKGTALTAVEWRADDAPRRIGSWCPVDHSILVDILEASRDELVYAVAAVDVPFGWPQAFAEMLAHHRDGPLAEGPAPEDPDASVWRTRKVAFRGTDLTVRDVYGLTPLSVSFNKLGATAAAWALIEADLSWTLDRSGQLVEGKPRILETYPAAQFRAWRPPPLKGDATPAKPATLQEVLDLVGSACQEWPGLQHADGRAAPGEDLLETNPHARDSLVCAITAAMTARDGKNVHPMSVDGEKGFGEAAAAEGIIWLHDPHFARRPVGHGSEKRGRSK